MTDAAEHSPSTEATRQALALHEFIQELARAHQAVLETLKDPVLAPSERPQVEETRVLLESFLDRLAAAYDAVRRGEAVALEPLVNELHALLGKLGPSGA